MPLATNKSFVRYDESPEVSKAKFDSALLLKHKTLLAALHEVDNRLSFKKTTLKDAMKLVIDENGEAWGIDAKHYNAPQPLK